MLELLQHQAGIQPDRLLKPLIAEPWNYRRKARLSVKFVNKKEKLLVGFREKNSHLVADISSCEILHPSIGKRITDIKEMIIKLKSYNQIPQLEIAVGDDDCAGIIIRHLAPLPSGDLDILKNFAREFSLRIYLQPDGLNSIHLLYPENINPLMNYHLKKYNLIFQFHPIQFIQVNAAINEKMIDQALSLLELKSTDRVLDLFCGIGNFSLPIARHCQEVVGVEGELAAINQARENAQQNNITNTQFYCADLAKDLKNLPYLGQTFDKIVLDPPRTGALEILKYLNHWQAKKILYISCNPATLARDAKILVDNGYRLTTAGIMDMFPHTAHVEAITLFER